MLPCYVLLDLETTGGNALQDRITEIALLRIEDGQEVGRWSTLVNPGQRIPPFIEQLTGIRTDMVQDAPRFSEVAPRLLQLLDGAVLVAHNVRFDHGFLQHELARLDIRLHLKTLCTVRLSRLLNPQTKGHGLDAIMQRHGIASTARHRAMGDVQVLWQWLALMQAERGIEALRTHARTLLQGSAVLPSQLETPLTDIPQAPGVYLFYGEGPIPLYIGKSVQMRSRVMSHFQAATVQPREMRIAQEVRRIEWVQTAGELGALLLEARLVKQRQPIYNRQLRRTSSLSAWRLEADPLRRPLLALVQADALNPMQLDHLYGPFRSKNQALDHLRDLAEQHALCLQALGLESGKGRCFGRQIGKCRGVCCGEEAPERHYLRLQMALAADQLRSWPFAAAVGLREYNPHTGQSDVHVFYHWCHLGSASDEAELDELLQTRLRPPSFDLDTYKLALKYLLKPGQHGLERIELGRPQSMSCMP